VNATIRDETVLGEASLVGMGAIITKDVGDQEIHLGARSTKMKKKSIDLDSLSHKSKG
jgi:acetyltransferase-like isoleucine patch superfamily enzyme